MYVCVIFRNNRNVLIPIVRRVFVHVTPVVGLTRPVAFSIESIGVAHATLALIIARLSCSNRLVLIAFNLTLRYKPTL